MNAFDSFAEGMPAFGFWRRRLAGMAAALTMSLVFGLMLATAAVAKGPVTHRVSAGGPDACVPFGFEHPGCDGNFSLVGNVYADGSMSGEYADRFATGNGFKAVLDCVSVVGNEAWVSGVITQGTLRDFPEPGDVFDLKGIFLAARVQDNGTTANDPVDMISFSILSFDPEPPCTDHVPYDLLDAPEGQVVVR